MTAYTSKRLPTLFVGSMILLLTVSVKFCISSDLLIGTGKVDSFSHFAGKMICHVVNDYDAGFNCRPIPNDNYNDNLTNLQNGSLDMALVNSKIIYDALHSNGSFSYISGEYNKLRLLMPIYRTPVSLIVRKDAEVSNFNDITFKRVNCGTPGSMENLVWESVLKAKEWGKRNFRILQHNPTVDVGNSLALKSGSIQAFVHLGMHPDIQLGRLLVDSGSEIIGIDGAAIDKMVNSQVGLGKNEIKAGLYPGQNEELTTLAVETVLIATTDTDTASVHRVLSAITGAKQKMQHTHSSFLQYNFGIETLNKSRIPPHHAAITYFQSNQNRLYGVNH